jgi:hypothetical protein
MHGIARSKGLKVLAVVLALTVLAACQPERPASGRATPVRKVLLIGDSITHGLFGISPRVHGFLDPQLDRRGIDLQIGGFSAETPLFHWKERGNPSWRLYLKDRIDRWNPDVVIIQTMLFPDGGNPYKQAEYLEQMKILIDTAQSRGAHTYVVRHPRPPEAQERYELEIAERLQLQAGAGKGVSQIPWDWWGTRCRGGFLGDGWHLTAQGQTCFTNSLLAAIDQLRDAVSKPIAVP